MIAFLNLCSIVFHMKTLTASLLRSGQRLIRNGRPMKILDVRSDRLRTGIELRLRDGSRVLCAHGDRCSIAI